MQSLKLEVVVPAACQSHQDLPWALPAGPGTWTQAQQETSKRTPGTGTPDRDPAKWTKLSEINGEPHRCGSVGTA